MEETHVRFRTLSGAHYDLFKVDGEDYITREAEKSILGLPPELQEVHAEKVIDRDRGVTVGERFNYCTLKHGWISTSLVQEIEEMEQ